MIQYRCVDKLVNPFWGITVSDGEDAALLLEINRALLEEDISKLFGLLGSYMEDNDLAARQIDLLKIPVSCD